MSAIMYSLEADIWISRQENGMSLLRIQLISAPTLCLITTISMKEDLNTDLNSISVHLSIVSMTTIPPEQAFTTVWRYAMNRQSVNMSKSKWLQSSISTASTIQDVSR